MARAARTPKTRWGYMPCCTYHPWHKTYGSTQYAEDAQTVQGQSGAGVAPLPVGWGVDRLTHRCQRSAHLQMQLCERIWYNNGCALRKGESPLPVQNSKQ